MKRLAQIDMNLLVALDALLVEGSVTRAARRLGVSQPAVSQKLRRLRHELDDPLFVSGPRGLSPTPRASLMAEPLRALLAELADLLLGQAEFDPTRADRRFVVAGADLFELAAMPNILRTMSALAPGVTIASVPRTPDLFERLERGSVDFVVGPAFLRRPGIQRLKLGEDGFVVLVRQGHALTRGRFTMSKYLKADHLIISPGGTPGTFVDRALNEAGKTRRVGAQVASFLAAPFIVASSDLLATVPNQLADALPLTLALERRKLPFDVPPVESYLAWHERFERDPGHRWFRELALERRGSKD